MCIRKEAGRRRRVESLIARLLAIMMMASSKTARPLFWPLGSINPSIALRIGVDRSRSGGYGHIYKQINSSRGFRTRIVNASSVASTSEMGHHMGRMGSLLNAQQRRRSAGAASLRLWCFAWPQARTTGAAPPHRNAVIASIDRMIWRRLLRAAVESRNRFGRCMAAHKIVCVCVCMQMRLLVARLAGLAPPSSVVCPHPQNQPLSEATPPIKSQAFINSGGAATGGDDWRLAPRKAH